MDAEYADCEHCDLTIMRFDGGAWEHVDTPGASMDAADADWSHFAEARLAMLSEDEAEAELGPVVRHGNRWFTYAPLSVPAYAHKPMARVETGGYL